MKILPEEHIEFLDQEVFKARKIIVVGEEFITPKSGQAHERSRKLANSAYCYEEISVVPTYKKYQ